MALTITSIPECALFSSTAFLVIYLIFISRQIQGKPLSCELFHKAEMEPVISAKRRAKLTKTHHIMSRWVIIRRHTLQHLRWERINQRSHAAVTLFHEDGRFLSSPLPLGVLCVRGSKWEETGIVNRCQRVKTGGQNDRRHSASDSPFWVLNDHWSAFAGRLSPFLEVELHCFCKQ